jgi:hypothetical protein
MYKVLFHNGFLRKKSRRGCLQDLGGVTVLPCNFFYEDISYDLYLRNTPCA